MKIQLKLPLCSLLSVKEKRKNSFCIKGTEFKKTFDILCKVCATLSHLLLRQTTHKEHLVLCGYLYKQQDKE